MIEPTEHLLRCAAAGARSSHATTQGSLAVPGHILAQQLAHVLTQQRINHVARRPQARSIPPNPPLPESSWLKTAKSDDGREGQSDAAESFVPSGCLPSNSRSDRLIQPPQFWISRFNSRQQSTQRKNIQQKLSVPRWRHHKKGRNYTCAVIFELFLFPIL